MAFCTVHLIDDYQEKVCEAQVEFYLDNPEENEDRATVVKERPKGSGDYNVVLEPGFYVCVARKEGYEPVEDHITLKKGENNIVLDLHRNEMQ